MKAQLAAPGWTLSDAIFGRVPHTSLSRHVQRNR
jgi:hypothetical protein